MPQREAPATSSPAQPLRPRREFLPPQTPVQTRLACPASSASGESRRRPCGWSDGKGGGGLVPVTAARIRIAENVTLAEYAVPESRLLPVRDEPHFTSEEEETLAGIAVTWRELQADGVSEPQFRAALRRAYPEHADVDPLPEFQPFSWSRVWRRWSRRVRGGGRVSVRRACDSARRVWRRLYVGRDAFEPDERSPDAEISPPGFSATRAFNARAASVERPSGGFMVQPRLAPARLHYLREPRRTPFRLLWRELRVLARGLGRGRPSITRSA